MCLESADLIKGKWFRDSHRPSYDAYGVRRGYRGLVLAC